MHNAPCVDDLVCADASNALHNTAPEPRKGTFDGHDHRLNCRRPLGPDPELSAAVAEYVFTTEGKVAIAKAKRPPDDLVRSLGLIALLTQKSDDLDSNSTDELS